MMPRTVDMQNLRVHLEEVACGNITWLHKKQSKNVLQCFFVTLATITIVSRKKCFSKPSEHRPCVRFHLPASSAPHPTLRTTRPGVSEPRKPCLAESTPRGAGVVVSC